MKTKTLKLSGNMVAIPFTAPEIETDESASPSPTAPREVTIQRVRDCWMVLYVTRKHGCRHSPGQFDATSNTLEQVQAWIAGNPKLKLVESGGRTVKCVSYFYPTSDNAKRFGFPEGGYDVGLTFLSVEKNTCTTEAVAGFATEAEAMVHAETLAFPWASWQGKKGLCPFPAPAAPCPWDEPVPTEDEIGLAHAQSWPKAGLPDFGAHLDAPCPSPSLLPLVAPVGVSGQELPSASAPVSPSLPAHTPLPWYTRKGQDGQILSGLPNGSHQLVANLRDTVGHYDTMNANAALIVEAVTCHKALVAFVRRLSDGGHDASRKTIMNAKAALECLGLERSALSLAEVGKR
jgi:hypothetical protein